MNTMRCDLDLYEGMGLPDALNELAAIMRETLPSFPYVQPGSYKVLIAFKPAQPDEEEKETECHNSQA